MKALVTGATGFIGSHLAERLLKEGHNVSCLVRDTSDLKWLKGLNVQLFRGDCTEIDSLEDCVKHCDYIYHLAGLTKTAQRKEFYAANTKGTENIIAAAAKNSPNIKKFLYLSSLSALGPSRNGRLPDERHEPRPVSDYGRSKLEGEKAVLKYSGAVPVTILRPAAVYGPRDREFFIIFRFIKKEVMPYWGSGHVSLVHVDDLVDAILLAAEHKNSEGKTYLVSDGTVHSNEEIINEISSVLEARVLKLKVPKSLLPAIGFFGELISKIMGKSSMVNSDKLKELQYSDWVCDISRAKKDLNYSPRIELKEGMKGTGEWYRTHKWL